MQIVDETLTNYQTEYPIESLADLDKILFIDIETTGFTAKTSKLYLIGCMYYDETFKIKQFFAEKYTDERELLIEFFEFSKSFSTLIHFNGNNFDLPYIMAKVKEFNLEYSFDNFDGIDLYRRINPYKMLLKLDNCKQKTIEAFLGITREDKFSGGDLIGIYHDFVASQDDDLRKFLLLHNNEDVKGMLEILPILAYSDLFSKKIIVTKVSANYYEDESGATHSEIMMICDLPSPLKVPVSFLYDRCYFSGAGSQGMLRVPLYEEEMKFFYANYKDYYYLPAEDIALHKSVSAFVDKDHREQAKAYNCYTKKTAQFLPEWDACVTPFFKRDYATRELFFELTNERKTDRDLFSEYASHVLSHMLSVM